ncbi:PREDICTED: ly6/PLAUR domain-containing protein 8 [Chinchilla lanigera]|uniref:ly6/PLAUR domain-containing protein 8 n=1 Tax=Chinchilla lanigera TaxID=34839 RepID=UPI00038E9E9B|nr:PREDICTED: ly6/PLAUR domain-containing protein 8 [Chinchilla lanigera]
MRGVLIALIISALAVTAVESLDCIQCNSTQFCANTTASECPENANNSCFSSWANSSLGGTIVSHQSMFCSAANCSGETESFLAFTVRVSDGESFDFSSRCCQEDTCNGTYATLDSLPEDLSNTECQSCYGVNVTSCIGRPRTCYREERCVSLIAQYNNATETFLLKGCSNIRTSTCQFLSAGNKVAEGLIFQKFECTDATSRPGTQPSPGSRAFPNTMALASLFLLGLLL